MASNKNHITNAVRIEQMLLRDIKSLTESYFFELGEVRVQELPCHSHTSRQIIGYLKNAAGMQFFFEICIDMSEIVANPELFFPYFEKLRNEFKKMLYKIHNDPTDLT